MALPDWIRQVVVSRRESADQITAPLSVARRPEVIRSGLVQCLQGGATTVADITTWDTTLESLVGRRPQMLALRELIGLSEQRIGEQLSAARQFVSIASPSSHRLPRGLSPHAPYTAAPKLVREACRLSREHHCLVAMHLAESPEELELLAKGGGPFRDLLQDFGVWSESAFARGTQPMDYLEQLAAAHRALVVHGNYLDAEDWQLLSKRRASMAVVYCPRTHAYFQHPSYPLSQMLKAGVRVVLGTDGRASNPDLSLWRELQFAANRHPNVNAETLLRMVTIDAAESIGRGRHVGSLECGKWADMIEVSLDSSLPASRSDLSAVLLRDSQLRAVWIGGRRSACDK
jgi:cytosine/adenosine deaminase-related metal-dependent hydrolase